MKSGTKQTTWEAPAEYKALIDSFNNPPPAAPHTPALAEPASGANAVATPPRSQHAPSKVDGLEDEVATFNSPAEAAAAFKKMLEKVGVKPYWSWEQTMAKTIDKPVYRAVKTLDERKRLFQEYVDEIAQREDVRELML